MTFCRPPAAGIDECSAIFKWEYRDAGSSNRIIRGHIFLMENEMGSEGSSVLRRSATIIRKGIREAA
jgi:hypothetical protein